MAKRKKISDPTLAEFNALIYLDLNRRKNERTKKVKPKTKTADEKPRRKSSGKSTKGKAKGKSKQKHSPKNSKLLRKTSNRQGNREFTGSVKGLSFEYKRERDARPRSKPTILKIKFTARQSFQKKIKLINAWPGNEIKYFIDRFPEPIAIQTILTTKKGSSTFERASRFSDFSIAVTQNYVKGFILESMVSYQDNYIEYIEDTDGLNDSDWVYNPKNIMAITVRFIFYRETYQEKYLKSIDQIK